MKASIWFTDELQIQKVCDPVNYVDIQDAQNFAIMDTLVLRSFMSFLANKRVSKWSKDTVDNRVILTFTTTLVDPKIVIPIHDKSSMTMPWDIHRGDIQNNYSIVYVDLGILLAALNNPAFEAFNTGPFDTYISDNSVTPSPKIITIGSMDFSLIDEYEAANS